jgi:hypothetical protein
MGQASSRMYAKKEAMMELSSDHRSSEFHGYAATMANPLIATVPVKKTPMPKQKPTNQMSTQNDDNPIDTFRPTQTSSVDLVLAEVWKQVKHDEVEFDVARYLQMLQVISIFYVYLCFIFILFSYKRRLLVKKRILPIIGLLFLRNMREKLRKMLVFFDVLYWLML